MAPLIWFPKVSAFIARQSWTDLAQNERNPSLLPFFELNNRWLPIHSTFQPVRRFSSFFVLHHREEKCCFLSISTAWFIFVFITETWATFCFESYVFGYYTNWKWNKNVKKINTGAGNASRRMPFKGSKITHIFNIIILWNIKKNNSYVITILISVCNGFLWF